MSEKNPSNDSLYSSAENFRLLVETVKDYGIFMLDPDGFIRTWNEGAKNIKGYDGAEIIGKHFSIFYSEKDIKERKPQFELTEAARVGRFEDEGWRIRKDGSKFWANVIITALRKDGELIGFSKVTRDLSERKKLENELLEVRNALQERVQSTTEALLATQDRLSIALNSAHMGIFDWDVQNNKVFWSDTLLKLWDYRREDFPGTMEGVKERMHPEDIKLFDLAVKETFENDKDYDLDYRVIWPDKSIHWINAKGRVIRDINGKVIRFTGTGADITERKVTEERNRILAEVSMIFSSSLEYKETIKQASSLIVPAFASKIDIRLYEEEKLKPFFEFYESNQNPDIGSSLTVDIHVRGKVTGVITFITDKSRAPFFESDRDFAAQFAQRVALAVDAGKLYQSAQNAIRVREEVVAIVSHDLKTPLSGVLLNTQLLMRKMTKDEINPYIKKIERIKHSAERMNSLIEEILDVTKLEAGTFSIEPQIEEVQSFVVEAIELHKSIAEEKSIELLLNFQSSGTKIKCDRPRILQVLSNLLGNALKFTPNGRSILVNVETVKDKVKFSVQDSGPGISQDKIPLIFDRFWQAQATKKLGSGLGLFIAKSIVEAHQGQIWVESEEGKGANFIFTLPCD